PAGQVPQAINHLVESSDGALWMSTDGKGLWRFRDGQFTAFTPKTGLPEDDLNCVLADREGNIWLGTTRAGLVRLRPRRLINYTTADGLAHDDVWSISQARDGSVWIAAGGGLSRFTDGKFSSHASDQRLSTVLEDA